MTLLVVHRPLDPKCAGDVHDYRRLLIDPDAVRAVDLREIANILERHVTCPANRLWLEDFRDRYLNLDLSGELLDLEADH